MDAADYREQALLRGKAKHQAAAGRRRNPHEDRWTHSERPILQAVRRPRAKAVKIVYIKKGAH
jgi:hypothetical protein